MITIFYFSQQDGTNSLHQSNFFYRLLGIDLKSMGIDIRKLAHFSIYFALGFSCLLSFSEITRKHIFYSVLFSFVYALTDEFHQSLIPGRGPQFTDVLIDTTGALCGSFIGFTFFNIKNILEKRRKKIQSLK